MQPTRRNVLAALASVTAVGIGSTQVLGGVQDNGPSVVCSEINAEGEYIIFENTGNEEVDLSGYTVALEYGNDDVDQRKVLPDGTTVGAGETLTVATGAEDVGDADVTFDYDRGMLNNDESDVIALLTPEGDVVCSSGGSDEGDETTTTTTDDSNDDEEDETTTTPDGGDAPDDDTDESEDDTEEDTPDESEDADDEGESEEDDC